MYANVFRQTYTNAIMIMAVLNAGTIHEHGTYNVATKKALTVSRYF